MGEFELAVGVLHISILSLYMTPLLHACNGCNSTTATGRTVHQYATQSAVTGAHIQQCTFLLHKCAVTTSIVYLPSDKNILEDAALCRLDITDTALLDYLNPHSLQRHSWKILPVAPERSGISFTHCTMGATGWGKYKKILLQSQIMERVAGILLMGHICTRPHSGH